MVVRTLQAKEKDMSQDGALQVYGSERRPKGGTQTMAAGGMASDDTGVVGRDQTVWVYKALGLYPKSNGEPLKGIRQNGIKFTYCKVILWLCHGEGSAGGRG